jgi:dynein heavy chain
LNKLKAEIEVEAAKANEIKRVVEIDKNKCQKEAAIINEEKVQCQKEMDLAMPVLREAEGALKQIKPNDIGELKGYSSANLNVILKLIFDCCCIILQVPVGDYNTCKIMLKKEEVDGIKECFDTHSKALLNDPKFLFSLQSLEGDNLAVVNDETCELLEP